MNAFTQNWIVSVEAEGGDQ